LIKEYCDKCGAEIVEGELDKSGKNDKGYRKTSRYQIEVRESDHASPEDNQDENPSITFDVLCPKCVEAWRYIKD
jgi:hypothetical protein